jgi:hypothetical protein
MKPHHSDKDPGDPYGGGWPGGDGYYPVPGGDGGGPPGGDGGGYYPPYGDESDYSRSKKPRRKRFTPKPDAEAYVSYKDTAYWPTWVEGFKSTLAAHGLMRVMDQEYQPESEEDIEELANMEAWLYDVLRKKISVVNGREIIERHMDDKNIKMIIAELAADAYASPSAQMAQMQLMQWLATQRYSPRSGKAEHYCVELNRKMERYDTSKKRELT